jgi:hypothetical protein
MSQPSNMTEYGRQIASWAIPEYEKPERSKAWYIIAIATAGILTIIAFISSNFLLAVIVVLATFIIILREGEIPQQVPFTITSEGLIIGRKFFDYDELKDFAIVYKPRLGIKNLYFEFKSAVKQRLSIPLFDQNPLQIRENLLKYLPEDLERTDEPLSESLAKLFKL